MLEQLRELLDEAIIALEESGVSGHDVRNALISSLSDLALKRLGPSNELPYILNTDDADHVIVADLEEYNGWKTPSAKREQETA